MSTIVEREEPEVLIGPDAGVVRDARVRQTRRRQRMVATLLALVALGGLIAVLAGNSNSKSTSHARAKPAFQRARQSRQARGWYISPALEGGSYGWCVMEPDSASCATLPTENGRATGGVRAVGTIVGTGGTSQRERVTVLVAAGVRGAVANGRAATLHIRALLPYGLRIAEIEYAKKVWTEHLSRLLATGSNGKPLGEMSYEAGRVQDNVRWWEKPARPASGPCQIDVQGVPGLTPEWGHVAIALRPYPEQIIGRAFFSCVDNEYYLHNWPLETAILLDAQHPGQFPAPIPGMKPIVGAPGLFWAPGDWHGEITAVRDKDAWLLVAGGSGQSQREEVLRHLTASVRL
jgi:hypothetical protein